jgi:hypothetical protein
MIASQLLHDVSNQHPAAGAGVYRAAWTMRSGAWLGALRRQPPSAPNHAMIIHFVLSPVLTVRALY